MCMEVQAESRWPPAYIGTGLRWLANQAAIGHACQGGVQLRDVVLPVAHVLFDCHPKGDVFDADCMVQLAMDAGQIYFSYDKR